jgi:hypothetical protein
VLLCSAVSLVAVWCSGRLKAADLGDLKRNTVVPAKGQPESAAISTDGTRVAMMHREFSASGQVTTEVIEVRDVQSGREVSTFSLPAMDWTQKKAQYYVAPSLRYCDGGKYLLAYNGPDTLYVLDASSFHRHATIVLSELRLRLVRETKGTPFPEVNLYSQVAVDCSASSPIAALGVWADLGVVSLKLFDLDKGVETADLGGIFEGRNERYTGDGLAISPDGSKLALGTWEFDKGVGSTVEVVATRTRAFLKKLPLGDAFMREHQLAFAGEGALVVGEPECQPNGKCDTRQLPRGRTLRVWDFGRNGAVRTLGWPEAETYRYFGASATGDVVFGYTGAESYCNSCNGGNGELKVNDARFTVWDRDSGRVVARSPRLKAEQPKCPWTQLMGSCAEDEQAPELQLSANGKAVLVFWKGSFPPRDNDTGTLEVFRLP